EELEEFRAIVTAKLEKARQEYNDLVGSAVDNSASDEVMAITNSTDAGVDYARNVEIKRLADRQLQFIRKLEGALQRIDNKTYGICRVTGKLIPKERLRAVPHATLSIEAKGK
ncbi:MAG TPA: molecular chaperone DnaK, partial [Porphyromonadaceae bacterium]|nr:molecular chaperone DnaK [Porphyromonadaceae bacterium]